ncbi:ABC transporter permease [Paenibacillus thalictri]|uniref:ABC transporter permease n=1 Tax=Paenibacillus thalictri TaxID=2527873 RepID=A0A4Q9DTE5_9BACL|nr:ABC transporter permease [Paenibacillus thalictri]TBL80203.1 ABC transporter permease [Paenibacillus thalictri]
MNAYIQLTLAQLRIFVRNRSVIFFTVLFPILMMVGLGSLLGNGGGISLNASLIDQDRSAASKQFTDTLNELKIITFAENADEQQAMSDLKKGDTQLVIVVPSGYGAAIQAAGGNPSGTSAEAAPKVTVYYDETNMTASQMGLTIVDQVADAISKKMVQYKQLVTVDAKGIQAIKLKYIDFLVPGVVAMMIMSTNLNGVAGQIAAWRERGILRRMQSTTLKASTFIAAQITARLILNGFQALLVLVIGNLFFGTQVNGSWLLLIAFLILGTLTFMSIGFIIAGLAKTPESAGPIAGFISFPLMFLGGVFFPVKNMPDLLQPFVKLLPITHLSTALRQIMNVGADLSALWSEALLLGGWMIVAFVIASFTFKWE